jgi:hypothetical protein
MSDDRFRNYDADSGLYALTREMTIRARRFDLLPGDAVSWGRCRLHQDSRVSILRISRGYTWDGPSSFPDLPKTMRASLHHDALYERLRKEVLPAERAQWSACRKWADECFEDILKEDGLRDLSEIMEWAVDRFGAFAATPLRWSFPEGAVEIPVGRTTVLDPLFIRPGFVKNLRYRDVTGEQAAIRVTKIRPIRARGNKREDARQVRVEIEGVAPGRATARIAATASDYGTPVVEIPVVVAK